MYKVSSPVFFIHSVIKAGEWRLGTRLHWDIVSSLFDSLLSPYPAAKSVPQFRETYREGQLKRIYDNPSPEHHFHVEYRLLPGCGSGVHRTDVVTYGVVSKVFTEKDSRVVKCWEEDELTYYGWRHK